MNNSLVLAFLGDSIYEFYIRKSDLIFLFVVLPYSNLKIVLNKHHKNYLQTLYIHFPGF